MVVVAVTSTETRYVCKRERGRIIKKKRERERARDEVGSCVYIHTRARVRGVLTLALFSN